MNPRATTFPRMFTCPLALIFPPDILTFPIFPEVAVISSTRAYAPTTFPKMSMLASGGGVLMTPVMRAPFPMKFPSVDTTFPATVSESKDIPGITALPVTTMSFTVSCDIYDPFPSIRAFPRRYNVPLLASMPPYLKRFSLNSASDIHCILQ